MQPGRNLAPLLARCGRRPPPPICHAPYLSGPLLPSTTHRSTPHCSTPPSSFNKLRPSPSPIFPPRTPFSSANEPHNTLRAPLLHPVHHWRRRTTNRAGICSIIIAATTSQVSTAPGRFPAAIQCTSPPLSPLIAAGPPHECRWPPVCRHRAGPNLCPTAATPPW
jgi:hypothetical protein